MLFEWLINIYIGATVLFFAWLYGMSGVNKLTKDSANHTDMLTALNMPKLFSDSLTIKFLGAFEVVCAIAILLPMTRLIGLSAIAALSLFYLFLIITLLAKGRTDVRCSCSGSSHDIKISAHLIYRNAGLFLSVLLALFCASRLEYSTYSNTLGIWILSLLSFFILTLFYSSLELMIANGQKFKTLRKTY